MASRDVSPVPRRAGTWCRAVRYAGLAGDLYGAGNLGQNVTTGRKNQQKEELMPLNSIMAAVVPGTYVLQLFYTGSTNARVYTRWREASGAWSAEQALPG
jgi:hypothetical protein